MSCVDTKTSEFARAVLLRHARLQVAIFVLLVAIGWTGVAVADDAAVSGAVPPDGCLEARGRLFVLDCPTTAFAGPTFGSGSSRALRRTVNLCE